MQMENSTVYGIFNNKVQKKFTQAMDMHFNWVQYRIYKDITTTFENLEQLIWPTI